MDTLTTEFKWVKGYLTIHYDFSYKRIHIPLSEITLEPFLLEVPGFSVDKEDYGYFYGKFSNENRLRVAYLLQLLQGRVSQRAISMGALGYIIRPNYYLVSRLVTNDYLDFWEDSDTRYDPFSSIQQVWDYIGRYVAVSNGKSVILKYKNSKAVAKVIFNEFIRYNDKANQGREIEIYRYGVLRGKYIWDSGTLVYRKLHPKPTYRKSTSSYVETLPLP